jgi:alpha-ketoglutaric semialdehyde dehydrogenase
VVSLVAAYPELTGNWIDGAERPACAGAAFDKLAPHDGKRLGAVARSQADDVDAAVQAARAAFPAWAEVPPVQRGTILHRVCNALEARAAEMAAVVALETGKSPKEALGETGGAIALGRFFAGEGQRLYGRTATSGVANRHVGMVREPCGVAGLIIAANTPIANVAWKVFPALICGNAAVLKAAEDTPLTATLFARIASDVGLPRGVLNVVQGLGQEAGRPLVEHPGIDVLSFTGSTAVGKWIAETAGKRLLKVSLELGGKNPFVVCEDADLDNAVRWAALSAFSNAGQRCASGSRLIVCDGIYDRFRDALVAATAKLRVGPSDDDDLGPVINQRQLDNMVKAIAQAKAAGAKVLTGGARMNGAAHAGGFYMAPTLIEDARPDDEISTRELFGPITCLYRVPDFNAALEVANSSPYGLTAAIHTRDLNRAMTFARRVRAGIASINGGTYGSEPHMPFGGVKQSGNGTREPGTEALDIYSNLKNVVVNFDPSQV